MSVYHSEWCELNECALLIGPRLIATVEIYVEE